jgi:hypothetical protein
VTPAEELVFARTIRAMRFALWLVAGVIVMMAVGIVILGETADRQHRSNSALTAKAARLDHYCALTRGTVESVIQDIVHPLPEVARDPKDRHQLAGVAISSWNTLAEFDHRALVPCLRSPLVFGMAVVAPEILPCAKDDAACAANYASIALANFEYGRDP